jgi:hypothetical protein
LPQIKRRKVVGTARGLLSRASCQQIGANNFGPPALSLGVQEKQKQTPRVLQSCLIYGAIFELFVRVFYRSIVPGKRTICFNYQKPFIGLFSRSLFCRAPVILTPITKRTPGYTRSRTDVHSTQTHV